MQILTAQQMAQADKRTLAAGSTEIELIHNAGRALAAEILKHKFSAAARKNRQVTIFCGPGNNGADGLACALQLLTTGQFQVKVSCLRTKAELKGHNRQLAMAAAAAKLPVYYRPSLAVIKRLLQDTDLVVDALFGTGLQHELKGLPAQLATQINLSSAFKVAADLPSGLAADSGQPLGEAFVRADLTVSFFRPKLCHYLYPAAAHCGQIVIKQIGIKAKVLVGLGCKFQANSPKLWRLPQLPAYELHKYKKGHALIVAGAAMPGAAVLAASAASSTGAGLVSLHSSMAQKSLFQSLLPAPIVVRSCANSNPDLLMDSVEQVARDYKCAAALIGPGQGVNNQTAAKTLQLLAQPLRLVLDADAFTSFSSVGAQSLLFAATKRHYQLYKHWAIMTPHQGEFRRLFPALTAMDKLEQALAAAKQTQCIIVLKGADTIIASPSGKAVINKRPNARLAVGGSGDLLAGSLVALLAQGLKGVAAACCAVWRHSQNLSSSSSLS